MIWPGMAAGKKAWVPSFFHANLEQIRHRGVLLGILPWKFPLGRSSSLSGSLGLGWPAGLLDIPTSLPVVVVVDVHFVGTSFDFSAAQF